MRRFLGFAAVAAMLVAIPLSHLATARGGPGKTTICHVTQDSDEVETTGVPAGVGRPGILIEISSRAVEAHCDHGDCFPVVPAQGVRPGSCLCYSTCGGGGG